MMTELYSLIKKTSQQKGKKLKIICNINDVIRPMKSSVLYGVSNKTISFKEYSKIFWKKRDYGTSNGVKGSDEESKLIEKNLKIFENYQKERAALRKKIMILIYIKRVPQSLKKNSWETEIIFLTDLLQILQKTY